MVLIVSKRLSLKRHAGGEEIASKKHLCGFRREQRNVTRWSDRNQENLVARL